VNLKERVLLLEETKNDEARKVYLFHPEVMEVFVRRSKVRSIAHDMVFTYKGSPVGHLRRSFSRACRLAGIEDFRFHDLRHCFFTNMNDAGVDRSTIMKMAGHKTAAMFELYNSLRKEKARKATKWLDEYLTSSTIIPPEEDFGQSALTTERVSASNS
jgi:integrase